MTEYEQVTLERFQAALAAAREARQVVAAYTCEPEDLNEECTCYLSPDEQSGFTVADGYLNAVFSTVRGRGDDLVRAAIAAGADCLDCYYGFLPEFYGRFGFVEIERHREHVEMGLTR